MTGKCIKEIGGEYTFSFMYSSPIVGHDYDLEEATEGTEKQRNTREALIMAYWKAGVHPKYGGEGYTTFRDKLKRDIGAGFDKYIYAVIVDNKPKIKTAKKKEDIPHEVLSDPDMKDMIQGKLKSCSRYGKKANASFIDNIILDGTANGCNTTEWNNIINGMNDGS